MGDHPHAGAPQSADTGLGAARLSDPADGGREGGRYQPMFAGAGARRRAYARAHPIVSLVAGRTGQGIITLFLVSLVVFAATQLLPGNAARAILGFSATPQRIRALELELGLNRGWWSQYWGWLSGLPVGRLGASLANSEPVWRRVEPRLLNSAVLVAVSGVTGSVLGIALGAVAALRHGSLLDNSMTVGALAVLAVPEFVVAIGVVILFSTVVFHLFPGVSLLTPGENILQAPRLLVLPALSLTIVTIPYVYRMTRAATLEALESPYVEMARLKGVPRWRVLVQHALPNALPPTIQVVGLTFLRLAGGIVLVEEVFDFPGIGQGLVNAVTDRDIPVIQFIVVVLAAFYVVVNITTDVLALLLSPRRRIPT